MSEPTTQNTEQALTRSGFRKPFGQLGEIDFGLILGPDGKATSSAAFGQVKTNIKGSDVHVTVDAVCRAEPDWFGLADSAVGFWRMV